MSVIKSKLTSRGRITIPRKVRDVLQLEAGDEIAYAIKSDGAHMARAEQASSFATFSEWDGEADTKAYRGL